MVAQWELSQSRGVRRNGRRCQRQRFFLLDNAQISGCQLTGLLLSPICIGQVIQDSVDRSWTIWVGLTIRMQLEKIYEVGKQYEEGTHTNRWWHVLFLPQRGKYLCGSARARHPNDGQCVRSQAFSLCVCLISSIPSSTYASLCSTRSKPLLTRLWQWPSSQPAPSRSTSYMRTYSILKKSTLRLHRRIMLKCATRQSSFALFNAVQTV